jgi:hypothetical protein
LYCNAIEAANAHLLAKNFRSCESHVGDRDPGRREVHVVYANVCTTAVEASFCWVQLQVWVANTASTMRQLTLVSAADVTATPYQHQHQFLFTLPVYAVMCFFP